MKAGFIGLGAMGFSMASNLHKAGLLAGVWNRSPIPSASFCQNMGVTAYRELTELASVCDVLVSCVSADADLLEVIDKLVPVLTAGTLVIDCSTVSRATAIQASEQLAMQHCHFIDAPVSGGTEGAQNGTLTIMVGGDQCDVDRAQPILAAMGQRIEYMGPVGSGQATKAVNQVMCAGINLAVCEALAFAEALDLPLEKVIGVVGSGAAGNWFVNHRGPTMVRGEFPLGFKMALHLKDLLICNEMAAAAQGRLPLVEKTIPAYQQLIEAGHGDEDISALYRQLKQLFTGR